jgi:hypothetical protein
MKIFLKRLSLVTALTALFSINVYAADAAPTQLDSTPPPQEGALTADQTQPLPVPGSANASGSAVSGGSVGGGSVGAGSIGTAPAKPAAN